MKKSDLIELERYLARTYRREAASRRSRNPALAEQLQAWSEASENRAVALETGPLFAEAQ